MNYDLLGPCHHTHYEGGPHCVHTAYQQGREDMLAKCIAAVKEVRNELAHPDWVRLTARDGAQESVNELKRIQRALQEKP